MGGPIPSCHPQLPPSSFYYSLPYLHSQSPLSSHLFAPPRTSLTLAAPFRSAHHVAHRRRPVHLP